MNASPDTESDVTTRDRAIAQTWLSPQQALAYLPGMTVESVRGHIKDGSLQAVDISRGDLKARYKIRPEWCEDFIEQRLT